MNRRGGFGLSEFWELILTFLLFIIVVIIALYFVGSGEITVEAKVNAENAAFTCKNDLSTFLLFPTRDSGSFDDLILNSYASNDYKKLEEDVTFFFDKLIGVNIWKLTVSNSTQMLTSFGQASGRHLEVCSTYIPLPCKIGSDCRLKLDMEMMY